MRHEIEVLKLATAPEATNLKLLLLELFFLEFDLCKLISGLIQLVFDFLLFSQLFIFDQLRVSFFFFNLRMWQKRTTVKKKESLHASASKKVCGSGCACVLECVGERERASARSRVPASQCASEVGRGRWIFFCGVVYTFGSLGPLLDFLELLFSGLYFLVLKNFLLLFALI